MLLQRDLVWLSAAKAHAHNLKWAKTMAQVKSSFPTVFNHQLFVILKYYLKFHTVIFIDFGTASPVVHYRTGILNKIYMTLESELQYFVQLRTTFATKISRKRCEKLRHYSETFREKVRFW
jgi:hypothetical protein